LVHCIGLAGTGGLFASSEKMHSKNIKAFKDEVLIQN